MLGGVVFWLQVGGWLLGLGVGIRFRMVLGRGVAIRIVGRGGGWE